MQCVSQTPNLARLLVGADACSSSDRFFMIMDDIPGKTAILVILDGWGYSDESSYNAIRNADTPTWDRLWETYPKTLISASGLDVGLPDQQMGNSEVGHMNIGSGRVIEQDFTRIKRSIEDGSFYKNEVLGNTLKNVAKNNKAIHIMGLLSPGGVHSHQDHIFALIKLAEQHQVEKIYLHAFLDGRDTPPSSARKYLQQTNANLGNARFASLIGRFYAMDRNQNWDRTETTFNLIAKGAAEFQYSTASEALDSAYERGESDEFVQASLILDAQGNEVKVEAGDGIIFANYRADRARQLSLAFTKSDFNSFPRPEYPDSASFVSLTEYKADFDFPVVFPPVQHKNVFGEYIADLGLRQLRIAETEKYAHVTFFFNGGEEKVFANEDRILIPSPYVNTYDEQPEMNAPEVADKMVEAINSKNYHSIISNFANADMVGHTGKYDAAIKAIETLDECLRLVIEAAINNDAELLITADHGNAEQMREFTDNSTEGQPHTAHTNNLVPLIYIGRNADVANSSAALCDLAPTMLHLMGLEKPSEMTGSTIFRIATNSD